MRNQYYWALTDDVIAHHGILGQKWGVRRYQNSDGSLTPEGRRHIYGAGAYGGYEIQANRRKRSIEAARYQNDINKANKKLEKATKKGNVEKQAEYQEAIKKLTKNRDIYMKDLSQEEVELGSKYLKNLNWTVLGTVIAGPVGGAASGLVSAAVNGTFEQERIVREQSKARYEAANRNGGEDAAIKAAKASGLNQGDNYKMYRDAQAGNKQAQDIVDQWERDKRASKQSNSGKMTSKAIDDTVAKARKTGMYDMEFLESNGDVDPKTWEKLSGKALDDAYKKWLKDR